MNHLKTITLLLSFAVTSALSAQTPSPTSNSSPSATAAEKPASTATIASVTDRQVHYAELEMVAAAEAMPEDKYNFVPSGSGDFKGVRTFAQQVKHIANMNNLFWSTVLNEKPAVTPQMIVENGPDSLKTKAELVKYLKDSFALGHRAAKSLTAENSMEGVAVDESNKGPRLFWTTFAIEHNYGHYGQMVVSLRMHGIMPPTRDDGD